MAIKSTNDELIMRIRQLERQVDKLRQSNSNLLENHEQLCTFLDHMPGDVFLKDSDSNYIYCNNQKYFNSHFDGKDITNRSTKEVWPRELAEKLIADDKKTLREGIQEKDYTLPEKDGVKRVMRTLKFPILRPMKPPLIGVLGIDITKMIEMERRLEVERKEIEKESQILRDEIKRSCEGEEIVYQSDIMRGVLRKASLVAELDSTVLILGETGTGKKVLARHIHNHSSRKDRFMVEVNCAALPSTLIENEIFGREKGAYSGASAKQIGRFEAANGSTIFLDEIGELSIDLQSKFLRVIEDKQFERLGGIKTIKIDARIICGTNRDLAKAVKTGKFREDLYYRLNVFPIVMPPLRERKEDIPLLVWSFVEEFSKTMKKRINKVSPETMNDLELYPWPGNVRELRNIVERSMIICQGTTLHIEMPEISPSLKLANLSFESAARRHIINVLQRSGWQIRGKNGAAEMLDLKPTTLYSKMNKLGIRKPTVGV